MAKQSTKNLLSGLLKRSNLHVMTETGAQAFFRERENFLRTAAHIELLKRLSDEQIPSLLHHISQSPSQLAQDFFVLSELGGKRNGYFVEFGATDGMDLSNTHLLESAFGWNGILAEPARSWHEPLTRNRKCHIDKRCVWRESNGVIAFDEVEAGELSTISDFGFKDKHAAARKQAKTYEVPTISLVDLLEFWKAPQEIDYLSIDTEGSEFEILSNFDFSRYRFRVITCEHNFTPMREKIHDLLVSHNYRRKFEDISGFDDWYVLN